MTVDGYDNQAVSTARMVEPLEEVVDTMKEGLKSRHIERLGPERVHHADRYPLPGYCA